MSTLCPWFLKLVVVSLQGQVPCWLTGKGTSWHNAEMPCIPVLCAMLTALCWYVVHAAQLTRNPGHPKEVGDGEFAQNQVKLMMVWAYPSIHQVKEPYMTILTTQNMVLGFKDTSLSNLSKSLRRGSAKMRVLDILESYLMNVKVKSDLVYDKHSGELVSYVYLNNAGKELMNFQNITQNGSWSVAKFLLVVTVRGVQGWNIISVHLLLMELVWFSFSVDLGRHWNFWSWCQLESLVPLLWWGYT